MRLHNKPWASEFIAEHSQYAIAKPEQYKGKWHEVFGNHNPIHIEVGTGKGQFLAGMYCAKP